MAGGTVSGASGVPSLFADARTGHPQTRGGHVILASIAAAQIVLSVALAPLAALWYGLHEMPGWFRESIRPAAKTIRHGKSGPYRGIEW